MILNTFIIKIQFSCKKKKKAMHACTLLLYMKLKGKYNEKQVKVI